MDSGTLYVGRTRLERINLIEGARNRRSRRPYGLTGIGATTLEAQLERIGRHVQAGLRRLGRASA